MHVNTENRLHELEQENLRLRTELEQARLSQRVDGNKPGHPLSVINNMPAMIGYWDCNRCNGFSNQAYASWFGTTPEQMLGKQIREVIGEALYLQNLPYIDAVLRGEPQRFERAIPTSDGKQVRHALAEYLPDLSGGIVQGFYIHVTDITAIKKAETLIASEEKLRGLYELSPLGIALTDMCGRYIEFNEAFRKMSGYSADELKNLDYWTLTPKKYQMGEFQQLEALNCTGSYGPYEKEYLRRDGSLIPIRLNGMLIKGVDGRDYIWSIVEDISEDKRIAAELHIAATAFEANVGIMVTDASGVILKVNPAFIEHTGFTADELAGQTPRMLKSGRHDSEFYAAMWQQINQTGCWQGEIWDRRKNGEIYPKWLTITAIKDQHGTVTHHVATQVDISDRKEAENAIKNLAFYDPLTLLPNRRLLQDRLHQALASCERSGHYGALLFIDLDNFKAINDTLGHLLGDCLLQHVAQRLTSCMREGDTVERIGGDEFVVLLENLSQDALSAAAQTKTISEKILAALNHPYQLGIQEIYNTSSIGITLLSNQQQEFEELFKQADIALYQSKQSGRNTLRFFDPAMQDVINVRASLEGALRKALENQQFHLYYQIQVDHSHRPIGAEALIRWIHPERGMVSPAQFIPLAEDTGLILPIGLWVLETACAQIRAWQRYPHLCDLVLAVNVSARQFHQADFVEQVRSAVQHHAIDPTRLKLELTEGMLLESIDDTIDTMKALTAIGVSLSLDDFGTGYSSLQYLKRLPLNQLKIDQSFVRDLAIDDNDKAIVSTIISMARGLNLNVIAEGVETEQQRQFLENAGCRHYQGYLFGKPVPVEQFEALLTGGVN